MADEIVDDLFEQAETPEAPEVETPEAAPDPITEFRNELDGLRQKNELLETRLRDTQAWAHSLSQQHSNLSAQAMDAISRRDQPVRERPGPPTIPEDELDNLLTDPKALVRAIQEQAQYAAAYALDELAPVRSAVDSGFQAYNSLLEPLIEHQIGTAIDRARKEAADVWQIDEGQFDENLQAAYAQLKQAAQGNPIAERKLLMSPQSILTSVQGAIRRSGAPVRRKTPPPPTVPTKPGSTNKKPTKSVESLKPSSQKIANMFGLKDEDLS